MRANTETGQPTSDTRSADLSTLRTVKRLAASGTRMLPAIVLQIILALCGLLLACIVADVLLGVAARVLFHVAIPWTVELPDDLVVWLSFLGGTAAMALGSNITIDTVTNLAKRRRSTDVALRLVQLLLTLIAVLIWAYASLDLLGIAGDTREPATGFPLRWTRIALPISAVLVCFFIVVQFIRTLRGEDPLEHHYAAEEDDEFNEL